MANSVYQSEKVNIRPGIITDVEKYLLTHNLGNRGFEDGSKHKQLVGLLGEIIVIEKLTGSTVNLKDRFDGFDGGFDLIYKGFRIDVKTMERKSFVRPEFINNFYIIQQTYISDIIIFCSYHTVANIVEICGWIFKNDLSKLGIFYQQGTRRIRTDGSSFMFRQDNYEVQNKDLQHIHALLKL